MKIRKFIFISILVLICSAMIGAGIYAAVMLNSQFGLGSSTVSFTSSGVYFDLGATRSIDGTTVGHAASTYEITADGVKQNKTFTDDEAVWKPSEAKLSTAASTVVYTFTFENKGDVVGKVTMGIPSISNINVECSATLNAQQVEFINGYPVAFGEKLILTYTCKVIDQSKTVQNTPFNFTVEVKA